MVINNDMLCIDRKLCCILCILGILCIIGLNNCSNSTVKLCINRCVKGKTNLMPLILLFIQYSFITHYSTCFGR